VGVRRINFWLSLVARKTVWVYKVFWAIIETKPQMKIHKRLKQSLSFFLFIYLLLLLLLLSHYYYLDKEKNQRKNLFTFFYFFYFLKKTNYYYLFYYLFNRTKLGVDSCLSLLRFCLIIWEFYIFIFSKKYK